MATHSGKLLHTEQRFKEDKPDSNPNPNPDPDPDPDPNPNNPNNPNPNLNSPLNPNRNPNLNPNQEDKRSVAPAPGTYKPRYTLTESRHNI